MGLKQLVLEEKNVDFRHNQPPSYRFTFDFVLQTNQNEGDRGQLERIVLTDSFHSLSFLSPRGERIKTMDFDPRDYSQLQTFSSLGITSDGNGNNGYRPLLTGIWNHESGYGGFIYTIDGKGLDLEKINAARTPNAQIPKVAVITCFGLDEISSQQSPAARFGPPPIQVHYLNAVLQDVLLISEDYDIKSIAIDKDWTLYGLTNDGKIVYCDDFINLANHKRITSVTSIPGWKSDMTGMNGRQKFVVLTGVNYWNNYDSLLYAVGHTPGRKHPTLKLVSGIGNSHDRREAIQRSAYPIAEKFTLDFLGEAKDGEQRILIDEAVQAEQNSLFVSVIPFEGGEYKYDVRDIYYVLIDHPTERLFAVAKCRMNGIDRTNDGKDHGVVLHPSSEHGIKRIIYALFDNARIKKMQWEIR